MHSKQEGFGVLEGLIIVFVLALLAVSGWHLWQKSQSDTLGGTYGNADQVPKVEATVATDSEQKLISAAVLNYCKTTYKQTWKEVHGVTVSDGSISAKAENPVVKDSFARVPNAFCDSTEITDAQRFSGFRAYLKKAGETWAVHAKAQQTPSCSDFDGQGWPAVIVDMCYGDNDQLRAPYP